MSEPNMNETVEKPKRGRPRKNTDHTPLEATLSRVDVAVDRIEDAHSAERPPRVPMGTTLKLDFGLVTQDPAYHYHVVAGRDGKVEMALRAWYEHVTDKNGDNYVREYGRYKQYLMKIPIELYREDQDLKQQAIDARIKGEQQLARDEYVPGDRRHVIQKDGEVDPLAY